MTQFFNFLKNREASTDLPIPPFIYSFSKYIFWGKKKASTEPTVSKRIMQITYYTMRNNEIELRCWKSQMLADDGK